ncbi:MAG: replication factor C large subunit [Methanomicrobiaceae archaeon]|nr:replication factor C large subunit [Methanomicrobiaceae archaeon]
MDWTERYRPLHLSDIVGNGAAIRQIADWAREWTKGSRPLILYGKPGTGKTSAAHALARDMQWETIELNASDQRTKSAIERVAGNSSTTASLSGAQRKLIIIDEADNLHGTSDRGGAKAIGDLIRGSFHPIILIANDLFAIPKELKKRCEPVQFKALPARSIVPRLRHICRSEARDCNEEALLAIAESASGDMRAAVNMLYAAAIGSPSLDTRGIATSKKDGRATIFDLVAHLFRARSDEELLRLSYEVADTPDTIIQWVGENTRYILSPTDRNDAYRSISRADEFIGYTFRRQYYTLWRYATALMLIGTARASQGSKLAGRIAPPGRWKVMAGMRRQKAIRTAVLNKFSRRLRMPQQTLRDDFLTPIALMIDACAPSFAREFDLDADELNFFLHDRERSVRITRDSAAVPDLPDTQKSPPSPPEQETISRKKTADSQSTLFDGF